MIQSVKFSAWCFRKITAILSLIFVAVAAEGQESFNEGQTFIRIENPPIVLSQEVEAAIARFANPEIVVIPPGESLVSSQQMFCPGSSAQYSDFLATMAPGMTEELTGRSIDANNVVDFPTLAFAPACIGRQFGVIEVENNEHVWEIYRSLPSEGGYSAKSSWTEYLDRIQLSNPGVADISNLRPGQEIFVPPSSVEWIVPVENSNEFLNVLGNNLDSRTEIFSSRIDGLQDTNTHQIAEDCDPNSHGEILLEHGHTLAETLESVQLSRLLGRNFESARVQVYDGGVRKLRNGTLDDFANSLVEGSDKIHIHPLDQIQQPSGICPQTFDHEHGESVSGVALGGYFLALGNPMHQAVTLYSNNIFKIDVGNVDGGMCVFQSADEDRLALELTRLNNTGVDIVNLSISWEEDRNGTLKSIVDENVSGALLVVSAGNTGSMYSAGSNRYPGRYGGQSRSTMIVVGAVQSLQSNPVEMHQASSYHPEHVDITALGCNVPTVGFSPLGNRFDDGYRSAATSMRFVNGTSFAVPQVSFAGAMIKHLAGSDSPAQTEEIRQRILVSSDINGHLFDKVVHGRVLNVAKALNLYTDIVETADGRLLRGEVSIYGQTSGDVQVCPDLILPFESILKIAKVTGGEQDGNFIIYYGEAGAFETAICFEAPPLEIELVVDQGVNWVTESLNASAFSDVVFAFRR